MVYLWFGFEGPSLDPVPLDAPAACGVIAITIGVGVGLFTFGIGGLVGLRCQGTGFMVGYRAHPVGGGGVPDDDSDGARSFLVDTHEKKALVEKTLGAERFHIALDVNEWSDPREGAALFRAPYHAIPVP